MWRSQATGVGCAIRALRQARLVLVPRERVEDVTRLLAAGGTEGVEAFDASDAHFLAKVFHLWLDGASADLIGASRV